MKINLGELVEIKIELKDPKGFDKAEVTWVFENLTINRGRITSSKKNNNGLWVQLPSQKVGDMYHKFLKIESMYWLELEKLTIDEYQKKIRKGKNKVNDNNDNKYQTVRVKMVEPDPKEPRTITVRVKQYANKKKMLRVPVTISADQPI
jgi:hypothetical protein